MFSEIRKLKDEKYIHLIFILVGCNTAIKRMLIFNPNKINVSKSSNVSLLNRIRSNPGIYIEGAGVNAKVFTKGGVV